MTTAIQDLAVKRIDLQRALSISAATMWRWLKDGKLPQPDIRIDGKGKAWNLSTLHAAGVCITPESLASRQSPASSAAALAST